MQTLIMKLILALEIDKKNITEKNYQKFIGSLRAIMPTIFFTSTVGDGEEARLVTHHIDGNSSEAIIDNIYNNE